LRPYCIDLCFERLLFDPFYVRINEVQVIDSLDFRAHRLRVTNFWNKSPLCPTVLLGKNEAAGVKIKDGSTRNEPQLVV